MVSSTYSTEKAAGTLRMSTKTVSALLEQDWIQLERSYIDGLAKLLRTTRADHEPAGSDRTYVYLHYAQHLYGSAPPDPRSKGRVQARKICKQLVADGKAITLDTFCEMMAPFFKPVTIVQWASRRQIAVVVVGNFTYLSSRYARGVLEFYRTHDTAAVTATRLGIEWRHVYRLAKRGQIATKTGPDGHMRIARTTVLPAGADDQWLSVKDAAARIGVTARQLSLAACRGSVLSKGSKKDRLVALTEAEKWERRFNQLNVGFEWLDKLLKAERGKTPLWTAQTTYKALKISAWTLSDWSRRNLVPFYDRSFAIRLHWRQYPRRYILGLVAFAGGQKVTMELAEEYDRRCAAAKNIV